MTSKLESNVETFAEDQFGVHNSLVFGLKKIKDDLSSPHPLAYQETNIEMLNDRKMLTFAKMTQGEHACFRLRHEFEFAGKVGRLPCLKSSNLMKSVLRGTDDTIDVIDIFNNQKEFSEYNIDPHGDLYKL